MQLVFHDARIKDFTLSHDYADSKYGFGTVSIETGRSFSYVCDELKRLIVIEEKYNKLKDSLKHIHSEIGDE